MLQENDWLRTDGWLAELRDDGPAGDGHARPARGSDLWPEVLAEADARAQAEAAARAGAAARAEAAARAKVAARAEAAARAEVAARAEAAARAKAAARAEMTGRAVIGDQLRMPIMWCEMGYCISWHADPSALGEADNRARAIQAGWRIDALGRMTCPQCQQTTAAFRATRPVVLWDRATAMAMAARAAAPRYRTMSTAGRASDRRPRPAVGHQ
jgi:hypothetical protein